MPNDVLVIDDEEDICAQITGVFTDESHVARAASGRQEALRLIFNRRPDIVFLDVWLEGGEAEGLALLGDIVRSFPKLPVVMISGHGTIGAAVSAIKLGAYDFIEKPLTTARLLTVMGRAIETTKLRSENEDLRQRFGWTEELIGTSPAMMRQRQDMERIARSNSRVLISGPVGTGKELAARVIHRSSARAAGPFVTVNSQGMSFDGLEEEIFGHEAEVATAVARPGAFELAHRGTLFLEEVGDFPVALQAKVLQALHRGRCARLGTLRELEFDARIICSSSRSLRAHVEKGSFREDLYHRLAVITLEAPTLKERGSDIPALVVHFMNQASISTGLPPRQLTDAALAALLNYSWPGNIRQLRNVVDWILIMNAEQAPGPVGPEALPPVIIGSTEAITSTVNEETIMEMPLRQARGLFERQYLRAQMSRFDGNVSRTAHFVGMERSALHRKIRSLEKGDASVGAYEAREPSQDDEAVA